MCRQDGRRRERAQRCPAAGWGEGLEGVTTGPRTLRGPTSHALREEAGTACPRGPTRPSSSSPSSSQAWQRAQRVSWWSSRARKVPWAHGTQVALPQGSVQRAARYCPVEPRLGQRVSGAPVFPPALPTCAPYFSPGLPSPTPARPSHPAATHRPGSPCSRAGRSSSESRGHSHTGGWECRPGPGRPAGAGGGPGGRGPLAPAWAWLPPRGASPCPVSPPPDAPRFRPQSCPLLRFLSRRGAHGLGMRQGDRPGWASGGPPSPSQGPSTSGIRQPPPHPSPGPPDLWDPSRVFPLRKGPPGLSL